MNNTKPHIHIVVENDQPITTSRNVAENFNKQHKHVLEAIDELTEGLAENSANLFYETEYVHPQNKRTFREIYMTKEKPGGRDVILWNLFKRRDEINGFRMVTVFSRFNNWNCDRNSLRKLDNGRMVEGVEG